MKTGREAYIVDHQQIIARGVIIDNPELQSLLNDPVQKIIDDTQGKTEIRLLLSSVITTGFEQNALEEVLKTKNYVPDWLIGEALAEVVIKEEHDCEFPWPSSRDLKNPKSSATGADLVGFQKTGEHDAPYRFVFGEVKTSTEKKWPPQVVYGRGGLQEQIEDLKSSFEVKQGLILYLGHHAQNSDWVEMYKSAAQRYLKSGFCDSSLFGVLIRDVEPKELDIKQRAINTTKGKPDKTNITFYAIYLPENIIPSLPIMLAQRGGK